MLLDKLKIVDLASTLVTTSFAAGVESEKNKSYSEGEVLEILQEFYEVATQKKFPFTNTIPLWFEQFKKK